MMRKKRRIVGIIQARMGSRRLPNKSMLLLHGYPIVEWVFRRTAKAQLLDDIGFAIPDIDRDDRLAVFLKGLSVDLFRGSELDLIGRFYHASKEWGATHIVRITADCPFVSGEEIDRLIEFYNSGDYDYAYNHIPLNNHYPDGIGAEILSFDVLGELNEKATDSYDREHVSTYIRSNSKNFKIGTFDPKDPRLHYPAIKLDVDTKSDYKKLSELDVTMDMDAHEIITAARVLTWD